MRYMGLVLVCLIGMFSMAWAADEIVLGSMNDLTGPTSHVGKDFAMGIQEAITYLNDRGGINGKQIRLCLYDFRYKAKEEALPIFDRLREQDRVPLILQWEYSDTYALANKLKIHRVVGISNCRSAELCNPRKAPYTFTYGADSFTSARAALTIWYEEVWGKSAKWEEMRKAGRRPKLICFYMSAAPAAKLPIRAVKEHARLLGMEVGKDQEISYAEMNPAPQVARALQEEPTVIWHGNTNEVSVARAIKEMRARNSDVDHIVTDGVFDQHLGRLCGPSAEGVIAASPCAFLGMDVPFMTTVSEYCAKVNPRIPIEKRTVCSVRAWLEVLLAAKTLETADKVGKIDGPAIRSVLESIKEWSPFETPGALGAMPVTFTERDHRPCSAIIVYCIKDGTPVRMTEIDMRVRFPDKWNNWTKW